MSVVYRRVKICYNILMKHISMRFFVAVLSLAFLGVIFCGNAVLADDDLEDKKDDLEDLQEKKESYQKIINIKQNQETLLQSQISSLSSQTEKLENNIQENSVKLEETQKKMSILEAQIQQKEEEIAQQKSILGEFLRSYYDWNASEMRNVFFTGSDNSFSLADQSLQLQNGVSGAIEKIESIKRSLARDKEALTRTHTEIETLNVKLEQQTVYLESTKRQKEGLVAKTTQEKTQYQKKLSKVEEEMRDIEQEIQELEADKSSNIDMSKLPSKKSADFEYPVENVRITQSYGKTTFTRWYTFHNGTDFGLASGSKILAVADGKVLATGDCGAKYAYGKWVAIDHGNGLVSFYGHLSKQKVKRGDAVDQGDTIALSGNTGYSTGPHLHFSVFTKDSFEVIDSTSVKGVKIPTGAHLNPMRYLP